MKNRTSAHSWGRAAVGGKNEEFVTGGVRVFRVPPTCATANTPAFSWPTPL